MTTPAEIWRPEWRDGAWCVMYAHEGNETHKVEYFDFKNDAINWAEWMRGNLQVERYRKPYVDGNFVGLFE